MHIGHCATKSSPELSYTPLLTSSEFSPSALDNFLNSSEKLGNKQHKRQNLAQNIGALVGEKSITDSLTYPISQFFLN